MLYVEYGKNRLHGFRGEVIWKCWRRTTDACLYYKLTSPKAQRWAKNRKTTRVANTWVVYRVTLSLRRFELTSLRCHTRRQFQYGGCQRIGTWLVNGDSYVKIKRRGSKGMQEKKKTIMVVWCGCKNPSSGSLFGITRQSLVMPNNDSRTDFSMRTSHPWKILMFLHTG